METESQQAPVPEQVPEAPITPAPEKPSLGQKIKSLSKTRWFIPAVVLVLLLVGGAVWYLLNNKDANSSVSSSDNTAQSQDNIGDTSDGEDTLDPVDSGEYQEPAQRTFASISYEEQLSKFLNPSTGESWYSAPKKLSKLGYGFGYDKDGNPVEGKDDEYTQYYEMGKRGDKTIIMRTVEELGTSFTFYEKYPDGSVKLIYRPDANATEGYYVDQDLFYSKKVSGVDEDTHYDSLSLPRRIEVANGEYMILGNYESFGSFNNGKEPTYTNGRTKVRSVGQSVLFKSVYGDKDESTSQLWYGLDLPINSSATYDFKPVGTDKMADITWTKGNKIGGDLGFESIWQGCGSYNAATLINKVSDSDFVQVGTTNTGKKIYEFKSRTGNLLEHEYEATKAFYATYEDSDKKNMTMDEYVSNHGLFAFKSATVGWVAYVSGDYTIGGGCAKPVVYLYPEMPTAVNVRVGADVKVSEPLYNPKTGWNTFAFPNGQLLSGGRIYGSLFWEGPGHGEYPLIRAGSVVKRSEAETTMRRQLKQQGLNQQEIKDFMEYWAPEIPDAPYVRLTWFTTEELNRLAPLKITPRPDTVIRVFLDMEGLDKPKVMMPQKLNSIPRHGFTVVEWGGLSLKKLY